MTKSIDPLAVANELTFKCSLKCSTSNSTQCHNIPDSTRVLWYSDSNLVYNTSLNYNSNDEILYGFLNESIWTNYINTNVTLFLFVCSLFENFIFKLDFVSSLKLQCRFSSINSSANIGLDTTLSNPYYAGIKCTFISNSANNFYSVVSKNHVFFFKFHLT